MKDKINRKVIDCLITTGRHFKTTFEFPNLRYDLKGKCAGRAYLTTWEIGINKILLEENGEDYINVTIPHEVAHLVVYQIYGKRIVHGKEWKNIMHLFGLEPEIYHNYDTTNATVRTVKREYVYKCACRTANFTATRHRRSKNFGGLYYCKTCKQKLVYVGKTDEV